MNNLENDSIVTQSTSSPLRIIVFLQQRLKEITYHVSKVYLTALNAMFMARRVSSKTLAYTRVTTELRKFSRQMDECMQALSGKCSSMTYKIANCSKSMRRKKKIQLALQMTKTSNSRLVAKLRQRYKQETSSNDISLAEIQADINCELLRITDLTRIGQNLVVLSKVEAVHAEGYTDVLGEISSRIEMSLEEIDNITKEMKHKIA